MRLRKRVLEALYTRRAELVQPLRDHNHPHTQGMYDGLNYAINLLENRGRDR